MMVVYSYYPWDPRVKREAEALEKAGYNVDIVCLRDKGERPYQRYDHIRVYRVPFRAKRGGKGRYIYQYGMFFVLSFIKITDLFLHRKHGIIHVHTLPDFQVFSAIIPWAFGARVILESDYMIEYLWDEGIEETGYAGEEDLFIDQVFANIRYAGKGISDCKMWFVNYPWLLL